LDRRLEDRYGRYIIRQLKPEHQELLRNMAFNSQNVLTAADKEGRSPLRYEEIGYFSLLFMLEYIANASHKSFMENFATSTQTDITYEQFQLKEAKGNATQDDFEEKEEPDQMETEDDDLIDCTIKWLSMYNKTAQQKIMERVVQQETKEEEKVEVEEEQETQEPTVPPPTQASMECQTDEFSVRTKGWKPFSKRGTSST
jgi:hypothetical protein